MKNSEGSIVIVTGEDIPVDFLQEKLGGLPEVMITHDIPQLLPGEGPVPLVVISAHGKYQSYEAQIANTGPHFIMLKEAYPTHQMFEEIQTKTGSKNIMLSSCHGGRVLPFLMEKVAEGQFMEDTGFLIGSGSKYDITCSDGDKQIVSIIEDFRTDPLKEPAQLFATQGVSNAETMVYAKVLEGHLYAFKMASPKTETQIKMLGTVEGLREYCRNNLLFYGANGEWQRLGQQDGKWQAYNKKSAETYPIAEEKVQRLIDTIMGVIQKQPLSEADLVGYRNNALRVAVLRKQWHRLGVLCKAGADIDHVNQSGNTMLLNACRQLDKKAPWEVKKTVWELLAQGADAQKANTQGITPWEVSCREGYAVLVDVLLMWRGGEAANILVGNGITPLYIACSHGHVNIVKMLCEYSGVDINLAGKEGVTPLMIACYRGSADIAAILLGRYNIEVDKTGDDGATALHLASEKGDAAIVEQLIQHGADVNKVDENGRTPLWIAAKEGHADVVRLLLEHKAEKGGGMFGVFTPLMTAAAYGRSEAVDVLLAHTVDKEELGKTASRREAVAFFRERNKGEVDNETAKYLGKSAAQMARINGHEMIAEKIEMRIRKLENAKMQGSMREAEKRDKLSQRCKRQGLREQMHSQSGRGSWTHRYYSSVSNPSIACP